MLNISLFGRLGASRCSSLAMSMPVRMLAFLMFLCGGVVPVTAQAVTVGGVDAISISVSLPTTAGKTIELQTTSEAK